MSLTPSEFFFGLTDPQKFIILRDLIESMTPEFKAEVIRQLAEQNVTGETQVIVTSNEEFVRIDFGKPLAWFVIPKAHAMQLGVNLMTHAGAKLEQIVREEKPDA
jgi:lysozyme family protein